MPKNRSSLREFAVSVLQRQKDNETLCAVIPFDALKSNSGDMPTYRQIAMFVSPFSTHEVKEQLPKMLPNSSQIVVCRWGTQQPAAPNLISFPPPGKFKHYKIGFDGAKWYARLQGIVKL